jgi:uncharacterized protein with HEPN domain
MRRPATRLRLLHITDAIRDIQSLMPVPGMNPSWPERITRLALERAFEIISAASRHLPEDLTVRHPAIPWRKIAGIGNVLRHEYQRVDAALLLKIAQDDLPALAQACRRELDRLGEDGAPTPPPGSRPPPSRLS